jgi:release factor glutamine methyltransferase
VRDVGKGSGAIAITLALEEKNMQVEATDISEEALVVAKENAQNLKANVNFIVGDMLEPLIKSKKKYDLLVSNPPYIPQEEFVESLVKDNEPHVALFGGEDGMYFYEVILRDSKKIVKDKSIIAFEHGWNQKEQMERLIKKYYPQSRYEIIKDLNNKDRITIIYNDK